MEITFLRLSKWSCASIAVRDDHVTLRVPGYGPVLPLPHDLAHFVVEQQLGVSRGFWGSVAAGGVFPGMEVLHGRRPPHADERSRAVIKANGELINRCEMIVGGLTVILARRLDGQPRAALKLLLEYQSTLRIGALEFDAATLASLCGGLHALAARWQETPIGASLPLRWTVPVEDPRQPATRRHRLHGAGHATPAPARTGRR